MDLRWAGHGQNYPLGPDTLPELEAVHLAYARLMELREGRSAEVSAQMVLRPASRAPADFAGALDEWERRKEYRTPAGAKYGRQYARSVRHELGAYRLADFLPPPGADRLIAYRDGLVAAGMAPNTVANRLSVVGQVLAFAGAPERRWLASVPTMPACPRRREPKFQWIEEAHFRALRAEIYAGVSVAQLRRAAGVVDEATAAIFIERRRCYLSWLFYTGAHTYDADYCVGDSISLDMGVYQRRNHKGLAYVNDEWFPTPEPLTDDLRALQVLLDRPFYGSECVFGGAWGSVARQMTIASRRLGIGAVNPRLLRRSYAREMLRRGYTVVEVAELMGHVDTKMIREIYARTPRPPGSARSRWTRSPAASRVQGAVIPFPGKKKGS